jgi:hypothetical protein
MEVAKGHLQLLLRGVRLPSNIIFHWLHGAVTSHGGAQYPIIGRVQGRLHIISSRLGLIEWTGSIQIIKKIHHKMCNTNNVQLPHELLHGHNVCTKQLRIFARIDCKAGHSNTMRRSSPITCWAQRVHKRWGRGTLAQRPETLGRL